MNGLKKTKKKSRKRKRLIPLFSRKEVKFPKGLRGFLIGYDDISIFEPNGNFNANLGLRAIARRFNYTNKYMAGRLSVDPVQIHRWITYKNRVQKSWTLMIYNEFFTEFNLILGGNLSKSFRKDPDKIWKHEDEDASEDRYLNKPGPKYPTVYSK